MRRFFKSSILFVLAILFVGGFVTSALPANASSCPNKPVFVWLFGYTGDIFFPQSQLGVSVSSVVAEAKAISSAVCGASHLRLVSVVGDEPGANIQSGSIPAIKSFVSSLKPYASVLYGRIDLLEFNSRTATTLQSQVALFVSLGLNGVWFDHGPNEWQSLGASNFNAMMQSLIKSYPNLNIIMNQAVNKGGWINPNGNSWGKNTYISPSVDSGGCCSVNMATISALNRIYPGRVLLHFDAFAAVAGEPMGHFAVMNPSSQESTVSSLVHHGLYPTSSQYAYDFQFPVIGAWTYNNGPYHGTLYNSLTSGNYHQGTESSFINIMKTV
jgi:hypothetical protein